MNMKSLLRKSALAAAILAAMVLLSSVPADFSAFAQTTAPASTALSEATIKALQEALNKQGIAVKADGILTDETRAAIRKYQSQHHLPVTGEPDSATLAKLGVAAQKAETPSGTVAGPGMGMMSGGMGPQMMQSMPQGMMGQGMMGQGMMGGMAGQAAPQSGMGMMGSGQMPMGGGSGMQGGMMMCPMMAGMMQMQRGTMPGRMGGMGSQMGQGIGSLLYGAPGTQLSADDVKTMLEQALSAHSNPRLEIGKISEKDESTIVAEIVTKDGSLVQRLAFNRYPGLARQLP
jgi:hypothetical protein